MWTPIRPGAAWGDVATLTPGRCTSGSATPAVLAAQFDSARRLGRPDRARSPAPTGCGTPASSSATGSTRPRRRRTPPTPAPTAISSRPATSPSRRAPSRRSRPCSAAPTTRRTTPRSPTRSTPPSRRVRAARRPHDQRRADRLRAGDRLRPLSRMPPAGDAAGDRLAELVRDGGNRIATGFVGTPLVSDALTGTGAPRRGLRPAPGAATAPHGCTRSPWGDHGLGALGQHAARRHRQPGRDDLVQPLRARRRRRLAAPRRRRPGTGSAGLPRGAVRAAAGRRAHLAHRHGT